MKIGNSLYDLYQSQIAFQQSIVHLPLPLDSCALFQYHMTAMTEELGEVLKADKRWKTHRNKHFDPDEKLEELADVFITTMNLCIFSGLSANDLAVAVENKINQNFKKLNEESR